MGYSYLPSNTVRGKAHPWTSRVPSTGTQDMSSEVAKIAGDAVEAAAQEMRWWRFFFRDIFLGLCQTHTIHVFCLFTYIWWFFFMVHVGIYIYIYIIHAMGKGAIGKPWKLHMNISKIIPYFLEGMRKWWESELMQVDVYKSMGICLARDCTWAWSPHVRVEDLEGFSSAWPGCWLITHHCQLVTLGVSLLLEGGGSPK